MKIAYFDCFSGVSGDMFLGAMIDAGLSVDALEAELRKLPVEGWRLQSSVAHRHSIAATRLEVLTSEQAFGHHVHRHLSDILAFINDSDLDAAVKTSAAAIFDKLADAEATAHRVSKEEIHFHEVGAVDAIIDIVGAAIAVRLMGIDRVFASALPVGRGFVKCAHGLMPNPAPGTAELLKGVPVYPTEIDMELITPTGAAILTALAESFGPIPEMTVEKVGYGAGKRDLKAQPNMLRVFIGEAPSAAGKLLTDRVVMIETNIDDQSPETFGHLAERLIEAGALDAFWTPITMKKGRPAYQLSVLAERSIVAALERMILSETTTFGVRTYETARTKLSRSFQTVETPFGSARVKVGEGDGIVKAAPEFEDCRRLANDAGVPIRDVYDAAMRAFNATDGD